MEDLIRQYLRLAVEWGDAMSRGDSSASNNLHDELVKTFTQLDSSGHREALYRHTNHSNDAVRFWIASHINVTDPKRALDIYRELTASYLSFITVSAKWILKE